MDTPPDVGGGPGVDRCAEQRTAVARLCEEANRAQDAHVASSEDSRHLRRRLVTAERDHEKTETQADPSLRTDEKARAREVYEHARRIAVDDEEMAEATANWGRALDRINRTGRLAKRQLAKSRAAVGMLEEEIRENDRAERATRMAAETAEATCLDARVRLANCEEQVDAPAAAVATPFAPHAVTGGHAVAVPDLPGGQPLVIESLVSGDRRALELTATLIAEHTGLQASQAVLQIQELVDAIISVASSEGFLIFDDGHPFWAHLSMEESSDVIAALARLGFQFEPSEGWHAGRAPTPMDLSMALAYAGVDARNMRDLPSTDELRVLPASISVNARGFLASVAPDLAVDHLVGALGRRAKLLEPLWNEWGQIRPLLLSDRHNLGNLHG